MLLILLKNVCYEKKYNVFLSKEIVNMVNYSVTGRIVKTKYWHLNDSFGEKGILKMIKLFQWQRK